jgi:hypothetical protein
MLRNRKWLSLSCAALCAILIGLSNAASAKPGKPPKPVKHVMFIQQDKIVSFDPATGIGAETGTATGDITGTTTENFQFTITSFPAFTFNSRVGITDTDGDQIIFKNVGTGTFLVPALQDPTLGGNPGSAPFQVFGNGLGGPLVGTYEVLATSGKYVTSFPIGTTFPSKAVLYNPSSPPTTAGTTGSVYVEVSDKPVKPEK